MAEGIKEEREKLENLRERADYILDTSNMLTRELQAEIDRLTFQIRTAIANERDSAFVIGNGRTKGRTGNPF